MASPDELVEGETPILNPLHPFDFLAAEVRDSYRLVVNLEKELVQARREWQEAEERFKDYCNEALK